MLGVLFNTDRLDADNFLAYAQRVEDLGYESLWLPELFTRDPYAAAGVILGRTERLTVASGIANIYGRDPLATVAGATTLAELSQGRFILGLGVSNASLNEARGHAWQNPVDKLSAYLTAMKAVRLTSPQPTVPVHVAAHGPKMLATAAALADGANTYLMPLGHVREARQLLGDGATLNTMLFCLADTDPASARATARKALAYYTGLAYYHRAWRSFGFDAADFADGGSDQLIDALVAWGNDDAIHERVEAQLQAGASRVVVIPIGAGLEGQPDWRLLTALASG